MTIEKHPLLKDFPEHHHTIRHLKMNNAHFSKLLEEYTNVDNTIFHFESGDEACSDQHLEQLKMSRIQLKDSLFALMQKEEATL